MLRDRQARSEFDAVYPQLVTAAYHLVKRFFRYSPSQVDDAVAETMARAFERWEHVRRHANPVGWVVVCAKNVCLEQVRANERRARGRKHDVEIYIDLADETAVSVMVSRTLGRLSKRQRDVAVLRYLMDCDEATTAAATGMSISNVKTAAHEARQRLRALLADVYNDAEAITS